MCNELVNRMGALFLKFFSALSLADPHKHVSGVRAGGRVYISRAWLLVLPPLPAASALRVPSSR